MSRRADGWTALSLAAVLMLVYNANGREIGSYDSQPAKFAAREFLLRGTLSLNHVVGAVPAYAERAAFVLAADGRYRSAYSPVPSVIAAGISFPFTATGVIDLASPAAPAIIAVAGASSLTAAAVAVLFLSARRRLSRPRAVAIAIGVGLGTGWWSLASRTLWGHETAIFGMALAVYAFTASDDELSAGEAVLAGTGLALAGLARPQLAPMIAVVLAGIVARTSGRATIAPLAIVAAAGAGLMFLYWRWFGHVLGPQALQQDANEMIHWTNGWIDWGFEGAAGLLISPSRGLFVFSPVAAIALLGVRDAARASRRSPLPWCAAAALAQFVLYSGYSVWWAGHTYGPRYMLDVLPVLFPLAAAALARMRFRSLKAAACGAALAWSTVVSATGAFYYPHDAWNTSPVDVNRDHDRLWDWSDAQFIRCWRMGPSPQNFQLFGSIVPPARR